MAKNVFSYWDTPPKQPIIKLHNLLTVILEKKNKVLCKLPQNIFKWTHMENIKPFSFYAISNPEFPEVKFRVIVSPNKRTNANGATVCNEDSSNLFNYEDIDGFIQHQDAINNSYQETPKRPCHEATLFIIFTNHNF